MTILSDSEAPRLLKDSDVSADDTRRCGKQLFFSVFLPYFMIIIREIGASISAAALYFLP